MKIRHRPLFDSKTVEKIYSKKDGVSVSYVCTSGDKHSTHALDIFYRETPHPVFGNRYFGLFNDQETRRVEIPRIMVTAADWVEDLTFDMIKSEGYWHYSSHRHDMVQTGVGSIDGGREYVRLGGNPVPVAKLFVVRDGKFVEKIYED